MHVEVVCAVLVPLALLSLIPKKNHYYIAVVWPFLPIIVATGLRSMPRVLGYPLGIWVLFLGWFPYLAKSNPDGYLAMKMGRRPWVLGSSDFHGLLQTSDGNLDIRPYRNQWASKASEELVKYVVTNACTDKWMIIAYDVLPVDELQLRIAEQYPCLRVRNMPPLMRLSSAGIALLPETDSYSTLQRKLIAEGYEKVGRFAEDEGKPVWIYRRPVFWFQ